MMRPRTLAFGVALGTLAIGAATFQVVVRALGAVVRKAPIEARYKVQSIPTETPSWTRATADEQMSEEMVGELGTKNYISRTYLEKKPPAGREPRALQLHMAYYTGMVDTVPHVPDRCLVGAGWTIADAAQVLPLELDQNIGQWRLEPTLPGRIFTARLGPNSIAPNTRINLPDKADQIAIRVNPYIMPGSDRKLFAGYFFIANGGHCPSAEDVRLLAFRLQDTHAFYLKVQVSTTSVTSAQEYVEACRSLLGELLPDIMLCVPDWPALQSQPSAPAKHTSPAAPAAPVAN